MLRPCTIWTNWFGWGCRTSMSRFVQQECPNLWSLLNRQAQLHLPEGFQQFLSCDFGGERREYLRLADARLAALIKKTSQNIVGNAYRRQLSGVTTENALAEALCEIAVADSLGEISDELIVLRPSMTNGRECDVKIAIEGQLYVEVKRLADPWDGSARSFVKSEHAARSSNTLRPRSMDLFKKLTDYDVPGQLPQGTLNILFLFLPSAGVPGNPTAYVQQALFGDATSFDTSTDPALHDDGLYSITSWHNISACAYARIELGGQTCDQKDLEEPSRRCCASRSGRAQAASSLLGDFQLPPTHFPSESITVKSLPLRVSGVAS